MSLDFDKGESWLERIIGWPLAVIKFVAVLWVGAWILQRLFG